MSTDMIVSREDARARGLKRFFTSVPCDVGHIAERYVSGAQCCECNKAAFRAYRATNLDREKERRRNDYERNRGTELARAIDYQANLRAEGRDYYSLNAVAIRERKRVARRLSPKLVRAKEREARTLYKPKINATKGAWERRHPERRKQKRRNRRARELGATGRHTEAQIKRLYEKQRGRCAFCFAKLNGKYEVDHYIALARGGSNDIDNLQLLCRPCNQAKHATDPVVFAQRNGRLL